MSEWRGAGEYRLFNCPMNGTVEACRSCGASLPHRREEIAVRGYVPKCDTHDVRLVPAMRMLRDHSADPIPDGAPVVAGTFDPALAEG